MWIRPEIIFCCSFLFFPFLSTSYSSNNITIVHYRKLLIYKKRDRETASERKVDSFGWTRKNPSEEQCKTYAILCLMIMILDQNEKKNLLCLWHASMCLNSKKNESWNTYRVLGVRFRNDPVQHCCWPRKRMSHCPVV